jgi:hypothetical protein
MHQATWHEMADEAQHMMNENALLIAKDKLLMIINDGLRGKQVRDAREILSLENEIARVQPSEGEHAQHVRLLHEPLSRCSWS